VLRANMRHCAVITTHRSSEAAKQAFIHDRQDQSYGMIDGLGPLAAFYKTGAKAVTSITSAPDGTPPGPVNDVVPADAPAGSATGAGSTASDLGAVVTLMQTVRGTYSSGNPSKAAYNYPRPWRMTEFSEVVATGATDAFGYPLYKSDVIVAPQLLRQRSLTPATDGGFPSGHTNAFFLAGLTYAHAVPERFQELVTRAFELADSRIVAGMHSPLDVIGGRILATALAAAILADPANAAVKAAARAQALAYFETHTGTTADTLFAFAHSAPPGTDPYADREANADAVARRLTYGLPGRGGHGSGAATIVPQGAEVLLETRLPYLNAAQRREVLRTTALGAGHPLLDGPEHWGRLYLFAAAGGFCASDAWRNSIDGPGGLVKAGTGTLVLSGDNEFTGGVRVRDGVLVAGGRAALGAGDVRVGGGTLRIAADGTARIRGCYEQSGGTLEVSARHRDAVSVAGWSEISGRSTLAIKLAGTDVRRSGLEVQVLRSRGLCGRFASITVDTPGFHVEPRYTDTSLSVRITSGH
ncbi:MAG: phosphatase PAP2 family protein, partial [Catenulispora sp.]